MKQIICLSNEPWSPIPSRTQQLISRLRDVQILYFSPAQSITSTEHRKAGKKVRPNVTTYVLPPMLFPAKDKLFHFFQSEQRKISRFISRQAARNRFRSPLLWTTNPAQVHLLEGLEYNGLIYDCDRFWSQLPPTWEGGLAQLADLVFVASPGLKARLAPCSDNIALLPNGVNHPLFAGPGDSAPRQSTPLLAFSGPLNPETDLSPVLYAALSHPEWRFLLAGERLGNSLLSRLKKLPNVVFSIPRSLSESAQLLEQCQVLLDLPSTAPGQGDVIPCRMYEYLSTGKPIVSMLWPEQIEPFPDVVYSAHSEDEFVTLCAHALAEAPNWVVQRRRDRGAQAAWNLRSDYAAELLERAGLL